MSLCSLTYFGKKGMTVHIDVVLTKSATEIIKHVYYTVVYRCDQNMEDTLCISKNVLKEIKKDLPDVVKHCLPSIPTEWGTELVLELIVLSLNARLCCVFVSCNV